MIDAGCIAETYLKVQVCDATGDDKSIAVGTRK
jgi:hypothetical protein